jgi:hypothetical protein
MTFFSLNVYQKNGYSSIRAYTYIDYNSEPAIPVFRELFDITPRAIFKLLNIVRGLYGLIKPFPADVPFLEHLIKMFGEFHTQTITPCSVKFKKSRFAKLFLIEELVLVREKVVGSKKD